MHRLLSKFGINVFLTLLALLSAPLIVQAQILVNEIHGTVGQYTITSNGSIATIEFDRAAITIINASTSPMAVNWPTTLNSGPINAAIQKGVDTDSGGPLANAVFSFQNSSFLFPQPNVLIVNGNEVLTQNTNDPGFDFSPFSFGGLFTFTFNSSAGTDIQSVIQNGGQVIGSASFSQIATVPEPASIIIWSVVGAAGVGGYFARRKMKRAKA